MRFPYWINPAFKEFQEHKERWMPILAPSALLLKSYKTNAISWDTFAERYNTDINNNPNAIKLVQELRDRSDRPRLLHYYVKSTKTIRIVIDIY